MEGAIASDATRAAEAEGAALAVAQQQEAATRREERKVMEAERVAEVTVHKNVVLVSVSC